MTDSPSTKAMTIASAILMATIAAMLVWVAPSLAATKGDPLPKAVFGAVQVATANSTPIPTNDLIGRNSIAIFNNGPNTIWCGWKSSVTNATGFPVGSSSSLTVDVVADAQGTPKLYCIADTALQISPADTRYMEVK